MKRFYFESHVSAAGTQTHYVDAETAEEAEEKIQKGEGVFVDEFLEVDDIFSTELRDEEDLE